MSPRRALALMAATILLPAALAVGVHVADTRAARGWEPTPATVWVVRPRQTMWQYAEEHYPGRDPREIVERIRAANGGVDPGRLRPGRVLIVPEIGR